MDPIDGLSRFLQTVRRRAEAERTGRSRHPREAAPASRTEARLPHDPERLRRQVLTRLRAVDPAGADYETRALRAFVAAVLHQEFRVDAADEAGFEPIVEKVCAALAAHEATRGDFRAVLTSLRR